MNNRQYKLNKIKPKIKEERPGSLLFGTLTQQDLRRQVTPKYHGIKSKLANRETSFSVQSPSSNYQDWLEERGNIAEKPLKHSHEIQKNMKHIERQSPNFVNMKFNNYDNHVKNVSRDIYENMDVHNNYNNDQKVRGTCEVREDLPAVNLASSVGPSGRVFLYASSKPTKVSSPAL